MLVVDSAFIMAGEFSIDVVTPLSEAVLIALFYSHAGKVELSIRASNVGSNNGGSTEGLTAEDSRDGDNLSVVDLCHSDGVRDSEVELRDDGLNLKD